MTKKMFFWTLSVHHTLPLGTSAALWKDDYFFSTERKLEIWKKKNPDLAKDVRWGMSEISVVCAKELIVLSKKKIKYACQECGR